MDSLQLPFAKFSAEDSQTNAKSLAWELDIQLDDDRPLKFFCLIVFQNGPVDNLSIIKELSNRLIDSIRYQYSLLQGNNISITTEDFFEQCLQKANAEISNFLLDISTPLPIESWAMLLGMIAPHSNPKRIQFFASRFGNVTGWLLNNAQLETKKLISIFDIPDILPTQQVPSKFFKNILSSSLPKNDQLFFCTPNLLNYISLTELKNVLSTLNATSALQQLENQISFRPPDHLVAGMTLKLAAHPIIEKKTLFDKDQNAENSMQNLIDTQSETQKLLGNQVGFGFNQFSSFFSRIKRTLSSKLNPSASAVVPSASQKKEVHPAIKIVQITVQTGLVVIRRTIVFVQKRIPKKPAKSTSSSSMGMLSQNQTVTRVVIWKIYLNKILTPIKSYFGRTNFTKLFKSPIFYISIAVIAVLFISITSFRSVRQDKAETFTLAENSLQEIRKNLDLIDSHLIVGREADAVQLLTSSMNRLNQLEDVDEFADEKSILLEELTQRQSRLRKEIVINSPDVVISDVNQILGADSQNILIVGDSIKILSTKPQVFVSINRESKAKSEVSLTTDITSWTSATEIDDNSFALLKNNEISIINSNDGSSTSASTNIQTRFVGAISFNNRLYTVAPDDNQIYRSNRSPNYSVLTKWINDQSVSLEGSRDLAIDGSVYILFADKVIQFVGGRPANPGLSLDLVDPALQNAQKIWTDADTNRIYLLEPSRILVYEKTGKFVAQYLVPDTSEFVDFTVDLVSNQIYLLTSNQFIQIPL